LETCQSSFDKLKVTNKFKLDIRMSLFKSDNNIFLRIRMFFVISLAHIDLNN